MSEPSATLRAIAFCSVAFILVLGDEGSGWATASTPQGPDCAELSMCRVFGKCSASADGRCLAASDDDCLMSAVCLERGFCVAHGEGCHLPALTELDCFIPRGTELFEPCADGGLCEAVDGTCRRRVSRDEECRSPAWWGSERSECDAYGNCVAFGGVCQAVHDSDCARAELCRVRGRCRAVHGQCVAVSDATCQASTQCATDGACHAHGGVCLGTLDDCLRLPGCFEADAFCRVADGDLSGHCVWGAPSFEF